ncbi:hypothetical protein N7509_005540 [Penicillium cosmopolitanum]|uniref:Uncharacterized protein n=1 Tax=Penicillium cosmopolitanum TaxID=1131564 RepID=A0A9X0BA72_9EURO|nr:uncharacterized protein N7509_005540 [Penicillium cosmopolitanum]KAJ5397427.1 hypothetical protein N7509_005540 [Penicillium cosmopolitanum]
MESDRRMLRGLDDGSIQMGRRSRGGTYLRVQEKENLLFREAHGADPVLQGPETSNFKIDAESIGQPD